MPKKKQSIFRILKIPFLKNIINTVKFYVTFVRLKLCKFLIIYNSVAFRDNKIKVQRDCIQLLNLWISSLHIHVQFIRSA